MRSLILLVVGFFGLGFGNANAASPIQDPLRTELKHLASDIKKIIDKEDGGSVAIGAFTGSVDVASCVGPSIQLILSEELNLAGVVIDDTNHRFEVTGRYQPFLDTPENRALTGGNPKEARGLNTIRLTSHLVDRRTGNFLAALDGRLIFGDDIVYMMRGISSSTPPLSDPRDISKNIEQAAKNPQVKINGTRIAGQTDQYAIEVLLKNGDQYVAQLASLEKGMIFVPLPENRVYGVRLINNTDHEAAADLRIDGVNTFAFSEVKSSYWFVPPHEHVDIIGWHKTSEAVTEFKVVGDFLDTAAAKKELTPCGSIGLISASFSACWENESQRPKDERLVQGRGTGFGQDIKLKSQGIERFVGYPRDTISVRYER